MRRRIVLLVILAAGPAAAQTDEVVRAALYLTGADSPEPERTARKSWTTASSMNWNPSGAVHCPSTSPPGPVCWKADF